MGPVVSAIQLVAYLAGPAFAGTVTGFVVRTALTIGASMLFRALAPKPKIGSFGSGAASGVEQQRQLGEASPRAIALGWTIVAGSECALWASGDSDDNRFNTRVIAISDWPTTLQKIWVRGREITFEGDINTGWFACNQYRSKTGAARLWMRFVRGDWNQAADAQLISYANANGSWTSDDRLRGVSALLIRREYDVDAFQSGAPDNDDLRVEVKDAPVFDWRDVTQSLTDVTTWKPSDNAVVLVENALCLLRAPAQFSPGSTDPIVGPGLDFSRRPLAKLTAMANICDELVSGQPRYRAGGVVNAAMTGREIIDRFAAACAGSWVSSGDGGYLRPGHVPAPVMEIPSGALKANASDRYDPWSRPDDVVNTVVGSYPDPAQAWQITPLPPATDASWVATDGGVRTAQEDLSFCPYRDQAWRISVRKARGFRLMGARDFTGPHWLIELEPGDVVTAPDPALPYLATRWWMVQRAVLLAKQEGLTVQLTLNEIDSAIDAAPPALGAAASFTPSSLSRDLAVPPVTIGQRVIPDSSGGQYPELSFLIPDTASQGSGVVQLQGPATANDNALLAAATIRNIGLSRGLLHGEPVVAGWYRWRAAGRDVDGSVGSFASTWQPSVQVTAAFVAGDSARLGGVLAADFVAGAIGAVTDLVLTVSEKRDLLPTLNGLIASASTLVSQATTVGVTTEKTAFSDAIATLNTYLATLTTPVLWSDNSDYTNVAVPDTFVTNISEALRTRDVLQAAISAKANATGVAAQSTANTANTNASNAVTNAAAAATAAAAAQANASAAQTAAAAADTKAVAADAKAVTAQAAAATAQAGANTATTNAATAQSTASDAQTKANELISGVRTSFRAGLLGSTSESALNAQFASVNSTLAGKTDISVTNAIGVRVTDVEAVNATQATALVTVQNGLATKAESSTVATLSATVDGNEVTNTNFRTAQATTNSGFSASISTLTTQGASFSAFQSAQTTTNANTATSITNLNSSMATANANIATNATAISTAQAANATTQSELTAARQGQANLSARLTEINDARVSGDSVNASALSTLTTTVNGNEVTNTNFRTAQATTNSGFSASISTLTTQGASFSAFQSAQTTTNANTATSITNLNSSMATANANIATNATAISTAQAANATTQSELTAARQGQANLSARLTEINDARVSGDSVNASALSTLQASFNADVATNTSFRTAQATTNSSTATTLTRLTAQNTDSNTNLLRNSTFARADSWTGGGFTFGIVIGSRTFASFGGSALAVVYQDVPVVAGLKYSLRVLPYRALGGNVRVFVEWRTAGGSFIGYAPVLYTSSDGWVPLSFDGATAPTGAEIARVQVDNWPAGWPSNAQAACSQVMFTQSDFAIGWQDNGDGPRIFADITSLSTVVQNNASAQAIVNTNVNARFGTNEANISTTSAALATLQGATAVYEVVAAASGSRPARIGLKAGLGGANVWLDAARINFGDSTVFVDADDTMRSIYSISGTSYSRIVSFGPLFGANLVEWSGPSSVLGVSTIDGLAAASLSGLTAANANYSRNGAGNIALAGTNVIGGAGSTSASNTGSTNAGAAGSGWQTLLTLTCTGPAGIASFVGRLFPLTASGDWTGRARLTIDGVAVATSDVQTVAIGGTMYATAFNDLFLEAATVAAGQRTYRVQMERTTGSGTILSTDTSLTVLVNIQAA
ncbi:hypothetical protein MCERH10_02818 [Caulobacteraceae bacterium]